MVTYVADSRVIVRQESVSQLVANVLRERIIRGDLPDGSLLPRLDDLLLEFNVSKPSIREALRILETEGLVTVKRGKAGGAVVHTPNALGAAYTLGFILESQQATLADLAESLRLLEPVCASLCAQRVTPELVGELEALVEETRQGVDDEVRSVAVSRRFHERIVASCGNATLNVVIGSLEALWSTHQLDWACRMTTRFDSSRRLQGIEEHAQVVDAIRSGDPETAGQVMARHLSHYGYNVPTQVGGEMRVQRPPAPGLTVRSAASAASA